MWDRKRELKVMRVLMTVDYAIPMCPDNKHTDINGWTVEEIVEDWFKKFPMGYYHATRDGHRIGGSERALSIEFDDKKVAYEPPADPGPADSTIRLLKLCRMKAEPEPVIFKTDKIVLPRENALYETSALEMVNDKPWYRLRLIYAPAEAKPRESRTAAFLPVDLFDMICEFVEITPLPPKAPIGKLICK